MRITVSYSGQTYVQGTVNGKHFRFDWTGYTWQLTAFGEPLTETEDFTARTTVGV